MNQNIINNVLKTCNDIDKGIKSKDFTLDKVSDFIPLTNKIITSLFDSILIGEFVSELTNEQIQKIKESLDFLADIEIKLSENSNIEKTAEEGFNKFKEQIQEIQNILNYYFLFSEDIQIILQNPEKDEIFTPSKGKYQSDKDSDILKLFSLNLSLCFSDFLFTEKQSYYQEIVSIKDNLITLLSNSSIPILTEQIEKMNKKATFLLFKWCKRAELSGFSMLKENKIKEYKDNINNFGDKWKDWVTYIENHHYKEDEKHLFVEKIKESYIKIEDKELKNFTCQDIYSYIKYHKEIDKKIDKLDEIISILDKRRFCTTDNYDKNIRTIIYNYARNNRFSLFTETCDNREDLQKEYNKIDNKDNRNYFLQYKFIDKSIELLNAELSEKNENITIDQIEEIEKYLKEIEPEYETYKTNIEWILEHIYFIYRVSFDECIIDDIFIYSSFLLPLDNRKSKDGFEKVSDKFRELKSQLPLFRKMAEFNGDVSKVKQELFQFDEKIEKHDTKTIELMGLFSAIIAFVMGSIPTFQYMKNIYDVGIFFVAFATSLISFLLVLLLITRKTRINRRFWYQLILIVIFYIAMIVFTTYLSNKKDTTQTIQLQTEKTVIEEKITSNKTVDTLKQSKITKEHTTSTKDSLK
ncbi:hypothetical protein [Capnocytophaga leadbetteri]|uniref:hypothetical protein n=1 Tax=Capnocytophaga leadbetteri TaxID=327575 RepID=UPI0028E4A5C7|nr:hypothetical protein [Capnocytophaga leadbetteri]